MKLNSILVAVVLSLSALATGCGSASTAATPAPKAGCTSDGECASLGPCGRCVAGACKTEFSAACCGTDKDCPADKPRCRNSSCM